MCNCPTELEMARCLEESAGEAERLRLDTHLQACPESSPARAGLGQALCLSGRIREGLVHLNDLRKTRYLSGRDIEKIEKLIGTFSPSPCRQPDGGREAGETQGLIGVHNHARK